MARSKWKYKTVAIVLAFMMVYLLFAAVQCSIAAARQGGTAYQIMWFSIVVTYGGESSALLKIVESEFLFVKPTP